MNRTSAALGAAAAGLTVFGVGLWSAPAAIIVIGLIFALLAWLAMDVED